MRTPQASDFISVSSEAGGYSMSVPKAFGKNPLADLPQAEGAMLVRTAGNNLMLAATVLDPADTASFKATEALPVYENAKVYWQWQHGSQLIWTCRLSAHNDYHGDKLLLTAEAQQNGKTYQLLYVMPALQADYYLPQAIYSLDSFKLNQPERKILRQLASCGGFSSFSLVNYESGDISFVGTLAKSMGC